MQETSRKSQKVCDFAHGLFRLLFVVSFAASLIKKGVPPKEKKTFVEAASSMAKFSTDRTIKEGGLGLLKDP